MYTDIDAYQEGWGGHAMEEDVRRLEEETTALGLAVEEHFKNAASALYDPEASTASTLVEASKPRLADSPIHAKIVEILRREALSHDQLRRLAELQQVAAGFARIGEHARTIAGYSLTLRGKVETELKHLSAELYRLLFLLIRQTYAELHGSILVTNTPDMTTARRLSDEDAHLDGIYRDFCHAVQQAITHHPRQVVLLQQVLVIGHCMEEMGNEVSEICRAVLHSQPSAKVTMRPRPGDVW